MKKLGLKGFSAVEVLLILVIVGLISGVGYYVYRAQNETVTVNDSTVETKPASDESAAAEEAPACSDPSASDIENIEASITSANTAALEGFMATKVNVILAASEGLGERTAPQAVGDITSFITGASAPWDFDLPKAELSGYQKGFYKQYFPAGAVVGKSANKKLIAFAFNCDGKINGVFLATSADLL